MNKNITHLILSDGGLKGIVYVGVLQYLYIEDLLKNIKFIAGTSIGAYFALIFALKIPIEDIQTMLHNIIENIEKDQLCTINHQTFNKLFMKNGIMTLDFLFEEIHLYMKQKFNCDDMSFIDFVKRTGVNLYVSTTNINTACMKIFCLEDTPDAFIIESVKASMSIPFLFEPIQIDGELFQDGCVSSSLSLMNIFKDIPTEQKLQIILDSNKYDFEITDLDDSSSFFFYISQVLKTLYINHFNKKLFFDKNNVIYFDNIPYENVLKFKITNEKIKIDITKEDYDKLILTGFKGASDFFQNEYNREITN